MRSETTTRVDTVTSSAYQARVAKRLAARIRFLGWLMFFATSQDTGLGDTHIRLLRQCEGKSTKVDLRRILRQSLEGCACAREIAIEKLNEQYPYARK